MRSIAHLAAALALIVAGSPALAQTSRPGIIRGAIVSVDGANVSVKTRTGEAIALHVADQQKIDAVIPAQLSDIKPGVFVGAAAMPGPDGP
jgi:hypothetical protein